MWPVMTTSLHVGLSTAAGQMSSLWGTLVTQLTGVQSKPQPTAVERIADDFLERIHSLPGEVSAN